MKKILFIHHTAGWSGSTKSLLEIIKHLDRRKYSVEVLFLKQSEIVDLFRKNEITVRVAKSIFYKKYYKYFVHSEAGYIKWFQIFKFIKLSCLWMLSRYYFAKKELESIEFDIAHINTSVLTDWLAPCKIKGKTIIHIREPFRKGNFDIINKVFRRQIVKFADKVIAISEDNAKRINVPNTTVIYNFLTLPNVNVDSSSYSSRKILYLGGSSPIKGFFVLVEALKYIDNDIKVMFAGKYVNDMISGNKIKKLLFYIFSNHRKRIKALKQIELAENALMIGSVTDLSCEFNKVCALVTPFTKPHFSRPAIEAHLHKKMAIGTDVEGMSEIIQHDINGVIVPENNPLALAKAINLTAGDTYKLKTFGENGYFIAKQKFTENNISDLEKLYFNI